MLLALASWPDVAAGEDVESAVKAAFLPKFAPFVEWPPGAFAAPTSDIVLCTQGADAVTALAARAAAGQTAWGRAIVVRSLATVTAQSGCHLAYIAGSDEQSSEQALSALSSEPVLTITNHGAHGMIAFVREGTRVRFDIDEAAAAAAGLAINSKLLNLAREVKRR
jgi:hypothetical protein